jgi:hypothetical protein
MPTPCNICTLLSCAKETFKIWNATRSALRGRGLFLLFWSLNWPLCNRSFSFHLFLSWFPKYLLHICYRIQSVTSVLMLNIFPWLFHLLNVSDEISYVFRISCAPRYFVVDIILLKLAKTGLIYTCQYSLSLIIRYLLLLKITKNKQSVK